MFRIRTEQLDAFRTEVVRSFKARMVEHLRALPVAPCRPRSGEELIVLVETGVERARAYGFQMEGPVRLFLELMFVFGDDFDTDLRLPWAAGALRRDDGISEIDRADLLHDEAEKHLTRGALDGSP
jgi:hypothetical protein